jgi:hypothetical protein
MEMESATVGAGDSVVIERMATMMRVASMDEKSITMVS